MRRALLLLLVAAAARVRAHVPTYLANDDDLCAVPPHGPKTSQVIYLSAGPGTSSGLEYHCPDAATCPIDFRGGQIVDFDAVFKERYDVSTFAVYVGCTGCTATDPINVTPTPVRYGDGTVEPFTTTRYYPLAGVDKTYNGSLLDPSVCADRHFGVRLVAHPNATTIVWGAVVGRDESFTFAELLNYPVYVLWNHGAQWTGLGYTLLIVAIAVPLLDLISAWMRAETGRWVPSILYDSGSLRSYLLQLSAWAWLVASVEILVHLVLAQVGARFGPAFWVALIVMIGVANLLPWWLTVTIWRAHLRRNDCYASTWWAPLEILSGASFLLLLGGGFYVGPLALTLDGVFRLNECMPEERASQSEDRVSLQEI